MEIERIDFQKNWNNKLLGEFFSTIRPVSKKYDVSKRYAVYLHDVFYCYADVFCFEQMTIQEIIDRKIHLLDTGKIEKDFMELMEAFYDKKSWWKGLETEMNVVFFKKLIQTSLFE